MRNHSVWLLLFLALCVPPANSAKAQSGILLKTLDVRASRLLIDPNRPRLYALLPDDSAIAVIDADTNSVIKTVPLDPGPADFSISPDGTSIYVASNGAQLSAINTIDLQSLAVVARYPVPLYASAIVAGLGGRLYVLGNGGGGYEIAQLDANTGVQQGLVEQYLSAGFLRLSPDGKTLYYAYQGLGDSFLESFDVSTTSGSFLDVNNFNYQAETGEGLTISHNGKFLVCPAGTGNEAVGEYTTSLIPTTNINGLLGTFNTGQSPGPATFSPDDSLLYQIRFAVQTIEIFNTSDLSLVDSIKFPYASPIDIAVSPTHGYVYVSGQTDDDTSAGPIRIYSTQPAPFFDGSVALSGGFRYLEFSDGVPFGYYNLASSPYLYHVDLGFEYPFDAANGSGGIYLYDFTSSTFWYTSSSLFPYLYDFSLDAWLYYYPNPTEPDHYNTAGVRYFYNYSTGKVIVE